MQLSVANMKLTFTFNSQANVIIDITRKRVNLKERQYADEYHVRPFCFFNIGRTNELT